MEGRRVEGVFLQHAIERSQALEAYKQAQRVQIKVLTLVPEIFLETLGRKGSQFKATVANVSRNRVTLNLPNGYQVEAENRLSLGINKGDILTLLVEEENPVTLQIVAIERGFKNVQKLIKNLIDNAQKFVINMKNNDFKEVIKNSGLFYENKLAKFLANKEDIKSIENDEKFKILKEIFFNKKGKIIEYLTKSAENTKNESLKFVINNMIKNLDEANIREFINNLEHIKKKANELKNDENLHSILNFIDKEIGKDLEKLEFINFLQNIMISEKGRKLIITLKDEDNNTSALISIRDAYRIYFNLKYEEGYIGIIMETPSKDKVDVINIKFFTDIEKYARAINNEKEYLKNLLEKENLTLGTFKVIYDKKESFENAIKEEFSEGVFHLRV